MADDTTTVSVRLPGDTADEFTESVEADEQFTDKSEVLRYLIDRWLAGEVW